MLKKPDRRRDKKGWPWDGMGLEGWRARMIDRLAPKLQIPKADGGGARATPDVPKRDHLHLLSAVQPFMASDLLPLLYWPLSLLCKPLFNLHLH